MYRQADSVSFHTSLVSSLFCTLMARAVSIHSDFRSVTDWTSRLNRRQPSATVPATRKTSPATHALTTNCRREFVLFSIFTPENELLCSVVKGWGHDTHPATGADE